MNFLICELVNIPKYQLRYNTQKAMHKQAPKCILLWKGNLNGDGQQFYQYQQIEQPHGVENLGPDLQQAN